MSYQAALGTPSANANTHQLYKHYTPSQVRALQKLQSLFHLENLEQVEKYIIDTFACDVEQIKEMYKMKDCFIHKWTEKELRSVYLDANLNPKTKKADVLIQDTTLSTNPTITDVFVTGGLTITLVQNLLTLKQMIEDGRLQGTDWNLHICDPKSQPPNSMQAKQLARLMGRSPTDGLPPCEAAFNHRDFTRWALNALTPNGKTLCKGLRFLDQLGSEAFLNEVGGYLKDDHCVVIITDNANKFANFFHNSKYYEPKDGPGTRWDVLKLKAPRASVRLVTHDTHEFALEKAFFFTDPLAKEVLIQINDFSNSLPRVDLNQKVKQTEK